MKLSLINIIENEAELGEAVGVPDNILETSRRLFDLTSEIFLENDLKSIGGSRGFISKERFNIADLEFNTTLLHFVFKVEQDADLIFDGMSVSFEGKFDDKKMEWIRYKDLNLHITTMFTISDDTTEEELEEFIMLNQKKITTSFAHELKHYYDQFKTNKLKLSDIANYRGDEKFQFGLLPIDRFIFMLYYTNALENLVRPTEIYADLKQDHIMQKDFYNFLLNTTTYKTLNKIRSFSYAELKQELRDDYMERVDELLVKIGRTDITDPDEKVNELCKLIYSTISDEKINVYKEHTVLSSIFSKFSPNLNQQLKAFEKFKKKVTFKSHDEYFMYYEKKFKFVADRMIKKISKLYSLLDPDKEEERQQKINEFRVDEQFLKRLKDKALEIGNKAGEVSRNVAGKVGDKLKNYSKQGDTTPPKQQTGRKYEETKANFIKLASDPTKILGFGEATGQNEGSIVTMAQMNAESEILKKLGKNEATFGTFIIDDAMFQLPNGNKQYLVVLEMTPPGKL